MGFIKAALSAGISSFQDSKFKEAITLPEAVPATALAIKGQLLTKDPDGRSRQSNQNTGLLTDGSVVIVPQGYVALLVNNGTFLGDLLEAGSHEWQAGENAWLFEKRRSERDLGPVQESFLIWWASGDPTRNCFCTDATFYRK